MTAAATPSGEVATSPDDPLDDGVEGPELPEALGPPALGDDPAADDAGPLLPFDELGVGLPFDVLGDWFPFDGLGDWFPFDELGDWFPFDELGDLFPFDELGDCPPLGTLVLLPEPLPVGEEDGDWFAGAPDEDNGDAEPDDGMFDDDGLPGDPNDEGPFKDDELPDGDDPEDGEVLLLPLADGDPDDELGAPRNLSTSKLGPAMVWMELFCFCISVCFRWNSGVPPFPAFIMLSHCIFNFRKAAFIFCTFFWSSGDRLLIIDESADPLLGPLPVEGDPLPEDVDGDPLPEGVDGDPLPEGVDGDPLPEGVDDDPTPLLEDEEGLPLPGGVDDAVGAVEEPPLPEPPLEPGDDEPEAPLPGPLEGPLPAPEDPPLADGAPRNPSTSKLGPAIVLIWPMFFWIWPCFSWNSGVPCLPARLSSSHCFCSCWVCCFRSWHFCWSPDVR
ncbi:unnamed protein product (mitochondrion) [Plasmodiophora brassicae]|uniref:Uncharacterized protein n=1 Tax=Plasmodiophora brassicae TaxID=37360 RepID=A0A0G4IMT4_PLABS|nr:hypothetical protein PBRA_005140 [Plasmodiophora brassicae]SPQ94589.1 unnamed protein product [Plasmodiophora brassicae]